MLQTPAKTVRISKIYVLLGRTQFQSLTHESQEEMQLVLQRSRQLRMYCRPIDYSSFVDAVRQALCSNLMVCALQGSRRSVSRLETGCFLSKAVQGIDWLSHLNVWRVKYSLSDGIVCYQTIGRGSGWCGSHFQIPLTIEARLSEHLCLKLMLYKRISLDQ